MNEDKGFFKEVLLEALLCASATGIGIALALYLPPDSDPLGALIMGLFSFFAIGSVIALLNYITYYIKKRKVKKQKELSQ